MNIGMIATSVAFILKEYLSRDVAIKNMLSSVVKYNCFLHYSIFATMKSKAKNKDTFIVSNRN